MSNKRILYSDNTKITSLISDPSTQSVWVAHNKNSNGKVILKRQSAFNPYQTFFELTRTINELINMDIDSSNLYVCYDDTTLIGEIISLNNPLTSVITIDIPSGITEIPVDLAVNTNDLFILTPGSGIDAKIAKFDKSGVFDQNITLTGIQDASSITSDDNDELWVVTNTSPAKYIRVYPDGGGGYLFTPYNTI